MRDFISLAGVAVLWLCIIGLIVLLGFATAHERRVFYSECLQHKQQFECDILWRTYEAANSAAMNAGMAAGMTAVRR